MLMKASSFIARTVLSIKYFFHFKKLKILHFEFVDIVLEEKPLLLISWEFDYCYRLSIPKLKYSCSSKYGSIILKIPNDLKNLEIIIASIWRKRNLSIKLTRVSLTKEVSDLIIQELNPLAGPELKLKAFYIEKNLSPTTLLPVPKYRSNAVQINLKSIVLKSDNLIYS
jgi:hypothetical protein